MLHRSAPPRIDGDPTRERGAVIVVLALVIVILFGFAGLAIDFGYAYLQKAKLQSMLDATALGCGQKGTCVTGSGTVPANLAVVSPLLIPFSGDPSQVNINKSAPCPAPMTGNDCIEVTSSLTWNTFFLSLFNLPELTVSGSALAVGGGPAPPEQTTPALMAVRSSGWNSGVFIDGGQPVTVQGDLVSNSTSPGITVFNNNISVTGDLNSASSSIGGFGIPASNVDGDINLDTVTSDPCEGSFTPPAMSACIWSSEAQNFCNRPNSTWTPATNVTYCRFDVNFSNPNCTLNLQGTIRVRDGVSINGNAPNLSLNGNSGFLFYVQNGNFQIDLSSNSNGTIQLRPQSAGPYAGLLVWQNAAAVSPQTVINLGTLGSVSIEGLVYSPSSSFISNVRTGAPPTTFPTVIAGQASLLPQASVTFVGLPQNVCAASSGGGAGGGGTGSGGTGKSRLVR